MKEAEFDVIVVGSGFGGGIAAWRLAKQGRRVLVLERGRRYTPGEFPRDPRDTRRIFWDAEHPERSAGLYDVRFFSGIATAVASGVGGGSLIYANNLVRPNESAFEGWPDPFSRSHLDPLYERIEAVLTPSPVPNQYHLPKRTAFRDAARALAKPVFDTHQAVSWMVPTNPGQGHCILCAECEFGCNHAAKNTVDLTFLREALAAGAKLWVGCEVSHIEPSKGHAYGRPNAYDVRYRDHNSLREACVTGRRVVLAGGTLGTTEILLRSRDLFGTLPNLSARLGDGFSGNGDFFATLQNSSAPMDPWYGPDVTSVMEFADPQGIFTVAAPAFSHAAMAYLASLGQGGPHHANWFSNRLWPHLGGALRLAFESGLVGKALAIKLPGAGPADRMTCLMAQGRDNAHGRVYLKEGRLDIEWDFANENRSLVEAMCKGMEQIAAVYGATFAPLSTWSFFEKTLTVHPLGGCRMGADASEGVVDVCGQVFGYPGLHVADGSVLPSPLGYHPALTIAAVALKFADDLVKMAL
ncbi:MAG: GMC family oxidoreductase [Burkholderiaceae bacterium]|jgi:cholesterol oxidase